MIPKNGGSLVECTWEEIEVYDFYRINKDSEDYYNNNPNEFKSDNDKNNNSNDADNKNEGLVEKAKEATEDAAEEVKDMASDAANAISGEAKYIEYRLGKLGEAKDRVKYTIDFTLTKKDGKWMLDDIDDATRQKIHGLYEH